MEILAFYPGGFSNDTLHQYAQARTGIYTDWHPPIMAAFWRTLMTCFNTPGIMLIVQNVVYWMFWAFLAVVISREAKTKTLIITVAFLPPMSSQTYVIWKDSQLAICVLACFALCFWIKKKSSEKVSPVWVRNTTFVFLLLFFCYGIWVRSNAIFAFFPLAIYGFRAPSDRRIRLFVFIRALVLIIVVVLMGFFVTYDVLKSQREHIEQSLFIFDIAGVFFYGGQKSLLPAYWAVAQGEPASTVVKTWFQSKDVGSLIWTGKIPLTVVESRLKELRAKWFQTLREEPRVYFQHRWAYFKNFLGIGVGEPEGLFHFYVDENPLGVRMVGWSVLKNMVTRYFEIFRGSLFFRGWFYGVVSLALVLFLSFTCRIDEYSLAAFYSALSAVIYIAGYFFLGTGSDFRYFYPAIQLTCFSAVMLIVSNERL
jgi:hypothetical protein